MNFLRNENIIQAIRLGKHICQLHTNPRTTPHIISNTPNFILCISVFRRPSILQQPPNFIRFHYYSVWYLYSNNDILSLFHGYNDESWQPTVDFNRGEIMF